MQEEARSRARRRRWLPWGLLAGTVVVAGLGGGLMARSLSAVLTRNALLEHEAAESEARVAELQRLRAGMARRLRALERSLGPAARSAPATAVEPAHEVDAQRAGRDVARKTLASRLKEELRRGDVLIEESHGELRVELAERLLFTPGQPTLTERGRALLARVGAVLAPLSDHGVRVESHTDEVPAPEALPGATALATGWELSAARAVAVARHLVDAARLPPERLSATGHAPSQPSRHRWRHRRVTLLLTPVPAEPVSAR